jgi:hypothetical protein
MQVLSARLNAAPKGLLCSLWHKRGARLAKGCDPTSSLNLAPAGLFPVIALRSTAQGIATGLPPSARADGLEPSKSLPQRARQATFLG